MKCLVSMTAITLLACAPAFAQDKIDNADAAAMKQLAQANLNEIEAGKAAESKAQGTEVKQFAHKMAADHTKMLQDLRALAKQKGVSLPDSASLRDKAERMKMEHASSGNFDHEYMQMMVKDHEKDVKETQDLAAKAKDPDFKHAVDQAHSKIDEHLRLAQQIAGRTSAATGSSSK